MPSISEIEQYVRAANYLVVTQLYLQENMLLQRPLAASDIKPRLLGHWGTCPGINFVYAQLNNLIINTGASCMFVLGPGHGFPALQANLFLEGTLAAFDKEATRNAQGIAYISRLFSWPYGFPSHTWPGTPGSIVEGGELGYALATAFGAALDNKDLIVACLIGDGEAETGPTAAAWQCPAFINPATNGAVLPILHVNGYKIGGPTILGRMSNQALTELFHGYGYTPFIVEEPDVYQKMADTLAHAYQQIRTLQESARNISPTSLPRWPMIIVKTPKGWTGPAYWHGDKLEGNNLSHQIVLPQAATDAQERQALEAWLRSYHFAELFNPETGPSASVQAVIPPPNLCMGKNPYTCSKTNYRALDLPALASYELPLKKPGSLDASTMRTTGAYLRESFAANLSRMRFFSPDEIYSNKLDAILAVTPRAFMLPLLPWDRDLAPSGQVIEMLSEHTLQALAQGYILTGRHAIFASYEAFIGIVTTMAAQHIKFLKMAHQYPWRAPCASLIYILTSSGWRQDHNGFSHQNPGFIGALLEKECPFVKAYFPVDSNSMLVALKTALAEENGIALLVAGKTEEPQWLTLAQAEKALAEGISIWEFASDPTPDIVFATIGDYVTKEALAAIELLKEGVPNIRIRMINIPLLSGIGIGNGQRMTAERFAQFFTPDKPVILSFHGYPQTIKALLFDYENTARFIVQGYREEGSTTTPFDMHVRNKTSRYHLVMHAIEQLDSRGIIAHATAQNILKQYQQKLVDHHAYIVAHGVDLPEIAGWRWHGTS